MRTRFQRVLPMCRFIAALSLSTAIVVVPMAVVHAGEAHAEIHLWTCGMHPQVIRDKPGSCPICGMALTPLNVDASAGGSTVMIDPLVVQNMGVRTEPVRAAALFTRVRAVGFIEEPEPNHLDINLRVSGWIEKLYANIEGMHVHEGDPLFDLYSPELQVAIEEMIAVRRAKSMPGSVAGLAPIADSAVRKLELLGLRRNQIEQFARLERAPATVTFYSPMSGHITEKMVYAGAAVKAGDRVLRLADRSTMWLGLQVYEQDLPFVRLGEHVTATVASLPGVRLEGDISFLHPHLDTRSRTAMARVVLPNPAGNLRQGMFASAEIRSQLSAQALLAPREAVIDTGIRQITFVALGNGRFEPRPVVMGASGEDGMVEIVSGLKAGDNVVTSGQFLLDAESRLREAIRKHLGEKLAAPASTGSEVPDDH